jgi:glucose-6-phosphate isomerase
MPYKLTLQSETQKKPNRGGMSFDDSVSAHKVRRQREVLVTLINHWYDYCGELHIWASATHTPSLEGFVEYLQAMIEEEDNEIREYLKDEPDPSEEVRQL